jgi:hypothetical protein
MDKPKPLLDLLEELEREPPEGQPWRGGRATLLLDGHAVRLTARECWLLFQTIESVEDMNNTLDAASVRLEIPRHLPIDDDVLDYLREIMDVAVEEAS